MVGRVRKLRFNEKQIIGVWREQMTGVAVSELCRKRGVNSPTFYKWKAKDCMLNVLKARRLRSQEDENAKLKRMLADAMLDNVAQEDLLGKKGDAVARREAAAYLRLTHAMSERRLCTVLKIDRASVR